MTRSDGRAGRRTCDWSPTSRRWRPRCQHPRSSDTNMDHEWNLGVIDQWSMPCTCHSSWVQENDHNFLSMLSPKLTNIFKFCIEVPGGNIFLWRFTATFCRLRWQQWIPRVSRRWMLAEWGCWRPCFLAVCGTCEINLIEIHGNTPYMFSGSCWENQRMEIDNWSTFEWPSKSINYASCAPIHYFSRYHHHCMHCTQATAQPSQELFRGYCEDEKFIIDRKKLLRIRAGLTDEDRRLVGCPFVIGFTLPSVHHHFWYPKQKLCENLINRIFFV